MAERNRSPRAAEPEREGLPPSMRDRVPFLLYRAAELSHALANDMLARIQLTARQVGILTLVVEWEPMTQKALGEMLRIDRTSMVGLVDDLERKGYVIRQRHPRDRRAFLHVPPDVPAGIEARLLREEADSEPIGRTGLAEKVVVDPRHDAEEARLSGAVRAEDPDLGPREERQVDAVQDLALGRNDLAQIPHGEDVLGWHGLRMIHPRSRL